MADAAPKPGLVLVALGTLALGACSSSVPRRAAAPPMGNQGGAWDLVLTGEVPAEDRGPEYSRRDAAMQWTVAATPLTRELANPHGPPTLSRARRVYLPHDPYGILYYRAWPESR